MKAEAKKGLELAVVAAMISGAGWDEIQTIVSNAYDNEFARLVSRKATPKRSG